MLVQNPDDRDVIAKFGVPAERIETIPGSGVDVDAFTPRSEPADSMITAAFVGRLLDGKGVRTLVRAHEILIQRGIAIRLLLAGAPDPLNPTSIPDALLEAWRKFRTWSCSAMSTTCVACGDKRISPFYPHAAERESR